MTSAIAPSWLDSSVGSMAEVIGSIPVQPEFFSGLLFPQLLKLSAYCDDLHLLKTRDSLVTGFQHD